MEPIDFSNKCLDGNALNVVDLKNNIEMFLQIILGRFLTGIAGGGYTFIVPVYIGEIASKQIRGTLLALFEVTVKAGILFIYIVASLLNQTIANSICALAVIVYFIASMFLPETPVYLMRDDKNAEARDSLKFLRGNTNIEKELSEMESLQQTSPSTFSSEMKNPSTKKAFFIIVLLFVFFQASGNNAILFYLTTILIKSGMSFDPFVCTIALGVIKLITVFVTLSLVDRCGRRFLLILSFIVMIIGNIGNGIFFHCKAHDVDIAGLEWLPLAFLCIFFIGFCLGIGSVTFILLGELFSISAKKIVAPMAQTTNFFLSFIVTLLFPLLSNYMGMHLMFYAFAICCFLGYIFVHKFLPETKGKSLLEIQKLLVKK